jgi:hypothetical protein
MDAILADIHLLQLVKFPTWSRTINGINKDSTLDHVYLSNPTVNNNLFSVTPVLGNHLIVVIDALGK